MKVLILSVFIIFLASCGKLDCEFRNAYRECVLCKTGFYLDTYGNCNAVSKNCQEAIYNGNCVRCNDGSMLRSGRCYPIDGNQQNAKAMDPYKPDNPIPFCQQYNTKTGRCERCFDGYYPTSENFACQKVPDSCKEYDPSNGNCKACSKGFELIPKGACASAPSLRAKDSLCKTVSKSGICQECLSDYFVSENGVCTEIESNCETSNAYGHCTMCKRGYYFAHDGGSCQRDELEPTTLTKVDISVTNDIECPDEHFSTPNRCYTVPISCNLFSRKYKKCISCYYGRGDYIGVPTSWFKFYYKFKMELIGASCQ